MTQPSQSKAVFTQLAWHIENNKPGYLFGLHTAWDNVREEILSVRSVTELTQPAAAAALETQFDDSDARHLHTAYDKGLHWIEFPWQDRKLGGFVRRGPYDSWHMRLFTQTPDGIVYHGEARRGHDLTGLSSPPANDAMADAMIGVIEALALHTKDFVAKEGTVIDDLMDWENEERFLHPILGEFRDRQIDLDTTPVAERGRIDRHALQRWWKGFVNIRKPMPS